MTALFRCAAGLALAAIGTMAGAQSNIGATLSDPRDARVQVGVVVPLGGGGNTAERAPRVEIWSDQRSRSQRTQPRLRLDGDEPVVRPMRLGVTLQHQPQLTLNGRELPRQDGRKGISALGVAGIGVVVVVIVLGIAVASSSNTNGLGY